MNQKTGRLFQFDNSLQWRMIRFNEKPIFFFVRAERKHSRDDCQTLFLCCVVVLFDVVQCPNPVANWSKFAEFRFLQQNAAKFVWLMHQSRLRTVPLVLTMIRQFVTLIPAPGCPPSVVYRGLVQISLVCLSSNVCWRFLPPEKSWGRSNSTHYITTRKSNVLTSLIGSFKFRMSSIAFVAICKRPGVVIWPILLIASGKKKHLFSFNIISAFSINCRTDSTWCRCSSRIMEIMKWFSM